MWLRGAVLRLCGTAILGVAAVLGKVAAAVSAVLWVGALTEGAILELLLGVGGLRYTLRAKVKVTTGLWIAAARASVGITRTG